MHAIDLDGVFLGCKHGVAEIKKHTKNLGGSIINISSISGIIAGANMAAYNSAKAGVRLLSKSVALHCAKSGYNIRCNSVHPTFIDTPILDKYRDRFGQGAGHDLAFGQQPVDLGLDQAIAIAAEIKHPGDHDRQGQKIDRQDPPGQRRIAPPRAAPPTQQRRRFVRRRPGRAAESGDQAPERR